MTPSWVRCTVAQFYAVRNELRIAAQRVKFFAVCTGAGNRAASGVWRADPPHDEKKASIAAGLGFYAVFSIRKLAVLQPGNQKKKDSPTFAARRAT